MLEKDPQCSAATHLQNKSLQVNYLQQPCEYELSGRVKTGPSRPEVLQIGLSFSVRVSLIKRSIWWQVTQETMYSYTGERLEIHHGSFFLIYSAGKWQSFETVVQIVKGNDNISTLHPSPPPL